MKKLLTLLLALVLCLGVLVACDTPEESSSSSSEETNSSSKESNEFYVANKISKYPIFESVEEKYTSYNVMVDKGSTWYLYEDFQKWIFNDYESLRYFVESNANISAKNMLTEDIFANCFVIVIYRFDDLSRTENYGYHSFRWNSPNDFYQRYDGYYSITLEYTEYSNKEYSDLERLSTFDIIIVPREDSLQNPSSIAEEIYIETLVHEYNVRSSLIK